MPVKHIVLFQFKPTTSSSVIDEHVAGLLALKQTCLHHSTGKPYIVSASGGRDDTDGSRAHGFEYAFVLEFENDEDRTYYAKKDPVHLDYVKGVKPHLESILSVDYTF